MNKLLTSVSNLAGRTGLQIRKHSPEILLGAGVASFAATIVFACKATTKAEEVLDNHREAIEKAKKAQEIVESPNYKPEPGDEEFDIKKEKVVIYTHTALDFAKLFAPAVAAGSFALFCFFKAYGIANSRYLGAVALYNSVSSAFNGYRSRVREELGDDVDRHFKYGTEIGEHEITVDNGDGKKPKTVKEKTENISSELISDYAKFFDSSCPEWDPNPMFNLKWLRANETAANDILNTRGHIFLNEVYDMIGLPHTSEGAVAGWVKGNGDDYVDFGLYNPGNESARRFINGQDNIVLLDFNVDGVIWDKI